MNPPQDKNNSPPKGVSFLCYLNIKANYIRNAIKFLRTTTKQELTNKGFSSKEEAIEMAKWQEKELRNVIQMIKFERGARR